LSERRSVVVTQQLAPSDRASTFTSPSMPATSAVPALLAL
jgi:hypothetical protein